MTLQAAAFASEILARALAFGTPLLLATLGEIYAERSGVLNLGVEGMMVLGAFTGFIAAYRSGSAWVGLAAAAFAGGTSSLIHALFSITFRTKIQVVSGIALSFFGLGLTGVLGQGWEGKPLQASLPVVSLPLLKAVPVLGGALTDQSVMVYLGVAAAVGLWFVLFRSAWGIAIRSIGEDPAAADSLGVKVELVRYLCVFLGGVLSGTAGAYLSIVYRPSWTEGMTGGMGWIVIALTIFSFWNPLAAIGGAYLFGALFYLSYKLQPYLAPELLTMLPYLATIAVLVLVNASASLRRRMGVPAALGLPYDREMT
jgi:simple sugar transport system permease protein